MNEPCKFECDIGRLMQYCDDQNNLNSEIVTELKAMRKCLTSVSSDMAVLKSQIKSMSSIAALKAVGLLGGFSIVIVVLVFVAKFAVQAVVVP